MASQSREKHCAQKTNKARLPVESKSSLEIQRLQPSDGPTGSYSEPEVGFGDIAADLREARFWISSGWPTIRPEYVGWVSFSCSSQLPVAAREVSGDKADKWTGNASLQVLLSSHRAARLSDVSGHLWEWAFTWSLRIHISRFLRPWSAPPGSSTTPMVQP